MGQICTRVVPETMDANDWTPTLPGVRVRYGEVDRLCRAARVKRRYHTAHDIELDCRDVCVPCRDLGWEGRMRRSLGQEQASVTTCAKPTVGSESFVVHPALVYREVAVIAVRVDASRCFRGSCRSRLKGRTLSWTGLGSSYSHHGGRAGTENPYGSFKNEAVLELVVFGAPAYQNVLRSDVEGQVIYPVGEPSAGFAAGMSNVCTGKVTGFRLTVLLM